MGKDFKPQTSVRLCHNNIFYEEIYIVTDDIVKNEKHLEIYRIRSYTLEDLIKDFLFRKKLIIRRKINNINNSVRRFFNMNSLYDKEFDLVIKDEHKLTTNEHTWWG